MDAASNLFIADSVNNRIRRVDSSGTITKIAGTGEYSLGFTGDGVPAVEAGLSSPEDVAVDATGNLFIADTDNNRIRRVNSSGTISTFAGRGSALGDGGPAVEARLAGPRGVAVDAASNLYIADTYNNRIRRVDPSGAITTFAGR